MASESLHARLLIRWLLDQRRIWQDRCGPPTLDDVRAYGVQAFQIRRYLHTNGWRQGLDNPGRPDEPGYYQHPDYPLADIRVLYDAATIAAIGRAIGESPWHVLECCAQFAGPIPIHCDDTHIADQRGSRFRTVDGVTYP